MERTCPRPLRDARGRSAGRAPSHLTFLLAVQRHVGYDADTVCRIVDFDYDEAPAFLGDLPALAPIQALTGIGDIEQARDARYARLASPSSWVAPPFLRFSMTVLRVELAGRPRPPRRPPATDHGARGPQRAARRRDGRRRSCTWAAPSCGSASPSLRSASTTPPSPTSGSRWPRPSACETPPIAVHTAAELATTLADRGEPDDGEEAALLASTWRPEALRLGMQPWVTRLDAITPAASLVERGPAVGS